MIGRRASSSNVSCKERLDERLRFEMRRKLVRFYLVLFWDPRVYAPNDQVCCSLVL